MKNDSNQLPDKPDTVATDEMTCAFSEAVHNGVPIDWAYWCERTEITPHQAAKLFYCIDPILWPDDRIESGPIPNDLRIKLQRLEQRLAEVKSRWTLADLAETLGATAVPLSMQYAVQAKRKQAAGRYTLEEAANEIDQHTGDRAGPMLEKLMHAVRDARLPVYEPGQTGRYQPKTVRGFYEEAYRCDLNKWLAENEPRIAWRFPAPQVGAGETAVNVSQCGTAPDGAKQVATITTNRMKTRTHALDAVIGLATKTALASEDHHSVWAELVKLAESKGRPAPLAGYSSDGIQYRGKLYEEKQEFDIYTKKNLRDKMARDRAR
jgi:hypothetical protein